MINTRSWIGIFALLLSFPVFAADIEISDAWIRPTTQGYENAMVGLTLTTPRKINIIGASSPTYTTTEIRKLRKNKIETLQGISLFAKQTLVFGSESIHLALSGNKYMLNAGENVPVILTVQYANKTTADITFLAQPVRIRAGSAPLPIADTKEQTMPLPTTKQPAIPTQTPMEIPVAAEPLPPETEVIAEPIIAAPEPQATPEPAPQPIPEKILAEQIDDPVIPLVEDCEKYSKAIIECNQAGEFDDIIRCRNRVKTKFSCN